MTNRRSAVIERKTKETEIHLELELNGSGRHDIRTGLPFLDHMITLFAVHGFFDLSIQAKGDLEVDAHHTVEDVGLVLGDALDKALGDRRCIRRFGHAVTPMDDALADVSIDLSKRPYLVFQVPDPKETGAAFGVGLAREFFRAFAVRGGMNLHVNVPYGEDSHHIIESIFKSTARALERAISIDDRLKDVRSSKGAL